MLEIIFSYNNGEETCVLPVIPENMPEMQQSCKNDIFDTINGELNLIGTKSLRTLTLESFFPVNKNYSFVNSKSNSDGWYYVAFFNKIIDKQIPLRMIWCDNEKVISNIAYTIESFNTIVNRRKDIDYSLSLKEYRFIKIEQL